MASNLLNSMLNGDTKIPGQPMTVQGNPAQPFVQQQQPPQFNNGGYLQNNVAPQPVSFQQPAQQEKSPADIEAEKRRIQGLIHEKLAERMAQTGRTAKDEQFLTTTINQLFMENGYDDCIWKDEIVNNIIHIISGMGPLDALLADEEVTEIICCGYDNIWTERHGRMHPEIGLSFNSEQEFRNIIDSKILQPIGRRIDDAQPLVNARLADKSRVNIVIDPICAGGATLDIRKFKKEAFTIQDYLNYNSMSTDMAEFVKQCIIGRKNMIISGGTGSGKTTLMNCFCSFIPEEEAVITIEDTLELQLKQPCLRRLEARVANAEGSGAITIRDLLVNTLRMRPDRIIIGECRSHEVVEMLQAANTGHDGTLTSVHANTPQDALNNRLLNMYLMSGIGDVPEKAIKGQIASAIHVVIQIKRMDDGSRKVVSICEVMGFGKEGMERNNEYVNQKGLDPKFLTNNNNSILVQEIFKYDEKTDSYVKTGWIPTFWADFMRKSKFTIPDETFFTA